MNRVEVLKMKNKKAIRTVKVDFIFFSSNGAFTVCGWFFFIFFPCVQLYPAPEAIVFFGGVGCAHMLQNVARVGNWTLRGKIVLGVTFCHFYLRDVYCKVDKMVPPLPNFLTASSVRKEHPYYIKQEKTELLQILTGVIVTECCMCPMNCYIAGRGEVGRKLWGVTLLDLTRTQNFYEPSSRLCECPRHWIFCNLTKNVIYYFESSALMISENPDRGVEEDQRAKWGELNFIIKKNLKGHRVLPSPLPMSEAFSSGLGPD